MTGNLNLGAAVRIDATHMTVNGNPLLALNGALTGERQPAAGEQRQRELERGHVQSD